FVNVMTARLFDVDVFARLAGPDGHQRVPVVGRGNRDGVKILVLQCLADVLDHLGLLAAPAGDLLQPRAIGARVGVDEVSNLYALHARPLPDMGAAPAVQAGDGDVDRVVGTQDTAGRFGSRDR